MATRNDPCTSVVGMFRGSIIRLGCVFEDSAGYGQTTKAVLSETTKRYHDALDDCEIQILDAKWFLERQLALNKIRREAKAQQDALTAKRKLEQMKSEEKVNEMRDSEAGPAKRMKLDGNNQAARKDEEAQLPVHLDKKDSLKLPAVQPSGSKPNLAKSSNSPAAPSASEAADAPSAKPSVAQPKKRPDQSPAANELSETVPAVELTPRSPDAGTDDFNFESMFGDPAADSSGVAGSDLDFDLGLDTTEFDTDVQQANRSSLHTLPAGLDSYTSGEGTSLPEFTNNFDLPELTNTFDDFLNDENATGALAGTDDLLNDESIMNLADLDERLFE